MMNSFKRKSLENEFDSGMNNERNLSFQDEVIDAYEIHHARYDSQSIKNYQNSVIYNTLDIISDESESESESDDEPPLKIFKNEYNNAVHVLLKEKMGTMIKTLDVINENSDEYMNTKKFSNIINYLKRELNAMSDLIKADNLPDEENDESILEESSVDDEDGKDASNDFYENDDSKIVNINKDDLLNIKAKTPASYGRQIAKALFTKEELSKMLIRYGRPSKNTDRIPMDPVRLEILKDLVKEKYQYTARGFDREWPKIRAAINNIYLDLKTCSEKDQLKKLRKPKVQNNNYPTEYIYKQEDLLKIESKSLYEYSLTLASHLFTKTELIQSVILVSESTKRTNRKPMDPVRLEIIKNAIKYKYNLTEPEFENLWPSIKNNINLKGISIKSDSKKIR